MTGEARREALLRELQPAIEAARSFSGWSFSDIKVRDLEPGPPWDYEALVREHAAVAATTLDLGTGGAEFFSRVMAAARGRVVATEEWHVNAPIARDALAPIGGSLVRASAERALPFVDGSFDLIIDRHEAIVPAEVARVLAPGGTFITQQVGPANWREINRFVGRRGWFGDHLNRYPDELRASGCDVEQRRHEWKVAYAGIADLVYMLLVGPWEVPGFDPVAEIDALVAIEDVLTTPRGLELTFSRYLLIARRPQ